MYIPTLFVEKVDIATILLHNLVLGGYFHQIDSFHSGGNNNQIPPKATLKAGWIRVVRALRVVPNKNLQCVVVKVSRPGDSEVTLSVFESSCHLLLLV